MSIEDTQTNSTVAKPTEVPAPARGSRGELGVASAGLTMRQLWHAANSGLSLKKFARQLVKEGNQTAKEWFANKRGAKNAKRSDKAIARIAAERSATKMAKMGKKK